LVNGIYDGTLIINKSGDYAYNGSVKLKGKILGSDYGKFSIGDIDIEMINPRWIRNF